MAVLGISSVGMSHVAGAGLKEPPTLKFSDALKAAQPRAPARVGQGQPKATQRPAARALDQVSAAQTRMDQVLELAQSGKTFTPAELLALQTQVYRCSQELDLAGKVVEKATGGVKQVLQTQV